MAVDQIDTTEDRGQTRAALPVRLTPTNIRGFEYVRLDYNGLVMGRAVPYAIQIPRDPKSALADNADVVLASHCVAIMSMFWEMESGVGDLRRQIDVKDTRIAELEGRLKSAEARVVESERPKGKRT